MDKILGFLEDHVEKIVLAVVAAICMWLLVTRVVLSPNTISYDRQNHSPGSIDSYIRTQADELEQIHNRRPDPPPAYNPRLPEYTELLGSSVTGVDFNTGPAVAQNNTQNGNGSRRYNLPDIGQVGDVVAGHIRAVAYTPFEEITAVQVYSGTNSEPNDLDLVTIQGTYDVGSLYESFKQSFAGPDVKLDWRDPCLAEPVFAAVHLQRQEKNEDGIWSQWIDIPRAKIDHRTELFTIIEDARSLPPGGLTVRMMQYRQREVQQDLLQPAAYQIASANEEWFPPLLHREYKVIQASNALEERRRARDEENNSSTDSGRRRSSSTTGRRSLNDGGRSGSTLTGGQARSRTSPSTGRRTSRSGTSSTGQTQDGGRYSSRSRTSRTRSGREDSADEEDVTGREVDTRPTVGDVRLKLEELSTLALADLRVLDEISFWVHDDTVEPGKTYRYKIRLGVFSPVAGKDQLSQRDAARNNEVVLWSAFSDITEEVEIPRRLYFFAKGIQEAAKEVTVQVSKYVLGNWYSEDFKVRGGEVIGDLVEVKPEKSTESTLSAGNSEYGSMEDDGAPKEIDYHTGAMLVDVVAVNDSSGDSSLRARHYFEMLYSYDGKRIERMPVGDRYWPEELRMVRSEIRNSQREPKQPLQPWTGRRRGTTVRSYPTR